MIKVWFGTKGVGKSKAIVESCNLILEQCDGDVVFIDRSDKLLQSIDRKVRFINAKEFDINNCDKAAGFLSGLIANNFDIKAIYIDGITHITKYDETNYEKLYKQLEQLSSQYKVDFYISHSSETNDVPRYLLNYV